MTKEEIKSDADKLAAGMGYNPHSLNLDVINVKDAYCIGYQNGAKDLKQQSIEFFKWCEKHPLTVLQKEQPFQTLIPIPTVEERYELFIHQNKKHE